MDTGWSIFWSIGAMPIGLFICFFPVVLAWMATPPSETDKIANRPNNPAVRDHR